MTNAITQYEDKRIILMKSGLIHWVTKETGERMSEHLANQAGHSFIRISELGNITINSAEVEAVYNHQQYTDLCRVKSGEWQCSYGNWHLKKGECKCKSEWMAEQNRIKERERQAQENKPQTPEEIARSREAMTKMNEMAALDNAPGGIFRTMYAPGKHRKMRRSTVEEWEKKNGRPADLTGIAMEEEEITNNENQHDNA